MRFCVLRRWGFRMFCIRMAEPAACRQLRKWAAVSKHPALQILAGTLHSLLLAILRLQVRCLLAGHLRALLLRILSHTWASRYRAALLKCMQAIFAALPQTGC